MFLQILKIEPPCPQIPPEKSDMVLVSLVANICHQILLEFKLPLQPSIVGIQNQQ